MINAELLTDVKRVRRQLLDELLEMQEPEGYWTGELSTSALSTATTCVAFEMLLRADVTESNGRPLQPFIDGGLRWLAENVNDDGGWGDTVKSKSNISTTTLCRAALTACGQGHSRWDDVITAANAWIESATEGHPSLSAAIVARYGKDKTFSVPILMQCALAEIVEWNEIPRLPFELAVLPHRFYAAVKLPVVSYALPALIAIGQLLHNKNPTWFLPLRWLRSWAVKRTLAKLTTLQPPHGGFLEAAPLTCFVTMALAASGRADHIVAQRGASFLVDSVREDGSWPIDTNLATWVTTLVVNALGDSARDELPDPDATLKWLLDQQHTEVHPFTQAAPGGWAWTPLPGGVPDADDTAGAVRALTHLRPPVEGRGDEASVNPLREGEAPAEPTTRSDGLDKEKSDRDGQSAKPQFTIESHDADASSRNLGSAGASPSQASLVEDVDKAAAAGLRWLASLQNRDGGIPTFCRGWGTLPFDRSSCDITAHTLLALMLVRDRWSEDQIGELVSLTAGETRMSNSETTREDIEAAQRQLAEAHTNLVGFDPINNGVEINLDGWTFLGDEQRSDSSWTPLWFGNQDLEVEENPVYGTARVAITLFSSSVHYWRLTEFVNRLPPKSQREDDRNKRIRRHEVIRYLTDQINDDGGLGGGLGTTSSVEETAVAAEAIVRAAKCVFREHRYPSRRARFDSKGDVNPWLKPWMYEQPLQYLVEAIDRGEHRDAQPIGFYFAKLWYFEKLYPYAFALGALQAAVDAFDQKSNGEPGGQPPDDFE